MYLPPTVTEKEDVQSGYIVKVGPGYPLPINSEEEPWKNARQDNIIISHQALKKHFKTQLVNANE